MTHTPRVEIAPQNLKKLAAGGETAVGERSHACASLLFTPMPTLTGLGAADLRRAVLRFRDALRAHQEELNRLNVYPVPDGDTGTNMALTLESVCAELREAESMDEVCHAISRGSLMGARGNSGVILSQILRGLAEVFRSLDEIGPPEIVAGLRQASDAAYQAVMRPVEGTILTVVRETAEAVEVAGAQDEALVQLLERAALAAADSVAHTPDQLPVLREAGVVDAGGKGFTLLHRRAARGRRRPPDPRAGRGRDTERGRRAPFGRRPSRGCATR